jgi:methionyl-tRNA synthetase
VLVASGEFKGSLEEFVRFNHERQKEVLSAYGVSPNLFSASGFGRSRDIHRELCGQFFKRLYERGHLIKMSTPQFYDAKVGVLLNGRQVIGRCPIPGCSSEKAYADECALGHPYEPKDLIAPTSTLSGERPEMRTVTNWYIDLNRFRSELNRWVEHLDKQPEKRAFMVSAIREFLEPPALYLKPGQDELIDAVAAELPPHERSLDKNKATKLVFDSLDKRETACTLLSQRQIRYRAGKTLVPFRLTGNVEWGVPTPDLEQTPGLTFWVWPESLWAPISFSATYLESRGERPDAWKRWWCSPEARVYQFIGEDNIYFYSLAEMSMFMGNQPSTPTSTPPEGELHLPTLIANNHILYFDKKASSSGQLKPPMARDLLNYYTADQLRAHFFALGLAVRSVGFKPKPLNPAANEKDADPVLKDAFLLSNVFNKAVRSCFYTAQKHFEGRVPVGSVSPAVDEACRKAILDFELAMSKHAFHEAMALVDNFTRGITKHWSANFKAGDQDLSQDAQARQALIDAFHYVRVATVLLHPIAPVGTEMIREYLGVGEEFWSWEHIFEPLSKFMKDPARHALKTLEPRVDFFPKHASQVQY